jgi:hypothetical protein
VVAVTNLWIPEPVAVMWTVGFALVLLVHLWHAAVLGLRHRLWHLGHVLMAAGMVVMLWPADATSMLVPAPVGVVVYLAAAAGLAVALVVARSRGTTLGPLWLVSVVDLAWMAYMFVLMDLRIAWLSMLGALWFVLAAAGWAGGRLGRTLEHGGLGDPTAPGTVGVGAPSIAATPPGSGARTTTVPDTSGTTSPAATGLDDADAWTPPHSRPDREDTARLGGVVDGGRRDWSVRVTLTVMALGMAYMLLAMQFGMAPTPTGGMPGM